MKRLFVLSLFTLCVPLSQLGAGQVSGSGTTNYIPIWTSSSALGNSKLYQTGGNVGVGTTSPNATLDVVGRVNASQGFNIANYTFVAMPGGASNLNTAVGKGALAVTSGGGNTAVGASALASNGAGVSNVAEGANALTSNVSGSSNTALGAGAMYYNVNGYSNTAIGNYALNSNTAYQNTAVGVNALIGNTAGFNNTALGLDALGNNTTGDYNIAIGFQAAFGVSGSNTDNIHIGSVGASSDNAVIRIGTQGTQGAFYAAGIYGASSGSSGAIPVLVDSSGQLVTVSSSRRFKEDIHDMGEASEDLMRLRPVTFRYKKPLADGSQPIQYGLIAEEVAEVYPDLVSYSADGQVQSVKYQLLDPLLLNEVQREHAEIEALQHQMREMEAELAALSGRH